MSGTPVVVRPTVEAEWEALRALRMRALADAPSAFGQTLAAAQAQPDALWRERARGTDRWRMFVAVSGEQMVGLAGIVVEEDGDGQLISMWLDPRLRGSGAAADLVGAVLGWAREQRLPRVRLGVTEGNQVARRLYLRSGFAETGRTAPLPQDPSRIQREMAIAL